MDEKNDQVAHRRMVAGWGILRNHGRNNNSPATGHITTVSKQFRRACEFAGLSKWLVLYHARHAFGTYAMAQTKNPALVRDVMGHSDLRTTMIYQHPDLEPLRDAINDRNKRVM